MIKDYEFRANRLCIKCNYPLGIFDSPGPVFYFSYLCESCRDNFDSSQTCYKCGKPIFDDAGLYCGCSHVSGISKIEIIQNWLHCDAPLFCFRFDAIISYWIRETCKGDLRIKISDKEEITTYIYGKAAYEFNEIWMEYKSPIASLAPKGVDKTKRKITFESIYEKLEEIESLLRRKS